MKIGRARVLAIDPTPRGIAFVVLEGPERLIDWGVCYVATPSKHAYMERLRSLIEDNAPDLLVAETYGTRHGRKHTRANYVLHRVKAFAEAECLPLRTVSRKEVNAMFKVGKSKHKIACGLARFFPELEEKLPDERKVWETEVERMNIFDALSFGLTVLWAPDALKEIVA
jgi:hypothetical protein